jgi:hypothetical protein
MRMLKVFVAIYQLPCICRSASPMIARNYNLTTIIISVNFVVNKQMRAQLRTVAYFPRDVGT